MYGVQTARKSLNVKMACSLESSIPETIPVAERTIYLVIENDHVIAHCGSEADARMMLNYGEGRAWIQSTIILSQEYEAPSP